MEHRNTGWVLYIEQYFWLAKMSQSEQVLNLNTLNYAGGILTARDELRIWIWVNLT